MTWGNTCAHLQISQPPSKLTLLVLIALWTFLSAEKVFPQELKAFSWKNMGYFFVKQSLQLMCDKEKEGKIKWFFFNKSNKWCLFLWDLGI